MSAVLEENTYHADAQTAAPVVVVGTGPVGIRFVEELLRRNPHTPLVIYGNEPWEPYNRVRLASLLIEGGSQVLGSAFRAASTCSGRKRWWT